MRKMSFKQVSDIAHAVSRTEKSSPKVAAERSVVINNVPYCMTIYMDGPESPFIELLEEGEEELDTGYLHDFSRPEFVDIIRDILDDGEKEWIITNGEQICNQLNTAVDTGMLAQKALDLLQNDLTPDTVLSDFLSKLMGQYMIPIPEFADPEPIEKDAVSILNAYGGGVGSFDADEIDQFMDLLDM